MISSSSLAEGEERARRTGGEGEGRRQRRRQRWWGWRARPALLLLLPPLLRRSTAGERLEETVPASAVEGKKEDGSCEKKRWFWKREKRKSRFFFPFRERGAAADEQLSKFLSPNFRKFAPPVAWLSSPCPCAERVRVRVVRSWAWRDSRGWLLGARAPRRQREREKFFVVRQEKAKTRVSLAPRARAGSRFFFRSISPTVRTCARGARTEGGGGESGHGRRGELRFLLF